MSKLSDAQRERLEMLAEEAAEIVQATTKILRHGYDSFHPDDPYKPNSDYLQDEIRDLEAVLFGMRMAVDPVYDVSAQEKAICWNRKLRYTHHQRKP